MFETNPFAVLSAYISPEIMQGYVILMFVFVIAGTILDMMHKKSAKRTVSGGEKVSMAVATVANEVLTSGEFKALAAAYLTC